MALDYVDFDLKITTVDQANGVYLARVLNAPIGQAQNEFILPFSSIELENYILKMSRPRRHVRSHISPEAQAARDLGSSLYDAVFRGSVRAALFRSLDEAERAGKGLRICLHLDNAPSLSHIPWEYLYESSLNRFLAQSVETPIVRYLDLPHAPRPLRIEPPLRILVMIASPGDLEALDVEGEWARVQEATAELEQSGLVTVERLPQATLHSLQRYLRDHEVHILHYIGHGGFDRQSNQSVLLLESETRPGHSRMVSGHQLGVALRDRRSLRLCLLNACEGARANLSDPFSGVAQHLVQQGIPAVIAMQFEITDDAAKTLAHEFYSAVADGYPVDAALGEARKAIYLRGNDVEWGTPVLYMQGSLFDLEAAQTYSPIDPRTQKPFWLDTNNGIVWVEGIRHQLTEREYRLLDYMWERPNQLCDHQQLAAFVDDIDVDDVLNHKWLIPTMSRLRHKIEPNPDAPRYIIYVRERGYILNIPNEEDLLGILDKSKIEQKSDRIATVHQRSVNLFDNLLIVQSTSSDTAQKFARINTIQRSGITALAQIINMPPDKTLQIAEEYLLQVGIGSEEGLPEVDIDVVIHAEDIKVTPTRFSTISVTPREQEGNTEQTEFISFWLKPFAEGNKVIQIEFYYARHWLTYIGLDVTVLDTVDAPRDEIASS